MELAKEYNLTDDDGCKFYSFFITVCIIFIF